MASDNQMSKKDIDNTAANALTDQDRENLLKSMGMANNNGDTE